MSTPPAAPLEWVWLARIRRPQGRKGEVFADILTDFPEKFADRRHLWLIPENGTSSLVTGHDISRAAERPKDPCAPSMAQSHRAMGGIQQPNDTRKGGTLVPLQHAPQKKGGFSPCVEPREMHLQTHWLHKGGIVLHFAGIDSISAAETLAGLIVAIPRSERAALPEDEVYIGDLIGCILFDVSADPPLAIGPIEDVDRTAGPTPLLIVRGQKGEVLVPFAKSYLRTLDLPHKRLEMALPEGLTDL